MKTSLFIAIIGIDLCIGKRIVELTKDTGVNIVCAKDVKSPFDEPEPFTFINPGKDFEDTNFYELEPSKFMSNPKDNFKKR